MTAFRTRSIMLVASLLFAFTTFAFLAQGQGQGQGEPIGQAIQTLTSDIADLKARVAKLEGDILEADLVGTYKGWVFENNLFAITPGTPVIPATIESSTEAGTITLGANGSITGNMHELGNALIQGSWTIAPVNGTHDLGSRNWTWTYANGEIKVMQGTDTIFTFGVAAGGRLLVAVTRNSGVNNTELILLTRFK